MSAVAAWSVVAATGARAAEPEVFGLPFRVGLLGGWFSTSDDWDVLGERDAANVPEAGPVFGVRLGWRISRPWALQWETGFVLAPVAGETAGLGLSTVGVEWRALDGDVTPILGLGLGVVASTFGPGSGDLDLLAKAGAGVEIAVGDVAALRFDVALAMTDGVSGASWSPLATFGIDFPLWRVRRAEPERPAPTAPPVPTGCPAGVGAEACVDADGDGVIDAFDRCPIDPGVLGGCPDPDGDGVTELRDACPRDRGRAADWGCPR